MQFKLRFNDNQAQFKINLDLVLKWAFNHTMTKQQAIKRFGSVRELAEALDISVQAVYQWPDKLPRAVSDRINGAALRLHIQ